METVGLPGLDEDAQLSRIIKACRHISVVTQDCFST